MTDFRVSQNGEQYLDPGSAIKATTCVLSLSSFVRLIQISMFEMDKLRPGRKQNYPAEAPLACNVAC